MYDKDLVSDEDDKDDEDDDDAIGNNSDDSDDNGLSLAARLMHKSGASHAATIKALSCDVIELDDTLPNSTTPVAKQPTKNYDDDIEVLSIGDTEPEDAASHSPLNLSFEIKPRVKRFKKRPVPTLDDDDDDDDDLPTVDLGFGSDSTAAFTNTTTSSSIAHSGYTALLLDDDASEAPSKRAKSTTADRDAKRLAKEADRLQKQAAKAAKAQEKAASKQASEHAKQTAKLERQLSKAKKPEERLHQMIVHIGADVLEVWPAYIQLALCSLPWA
jgi:hypothetical protein